MAASASTRSSRKRRYLMASVGAMTTLLATAVPAFADAGVPSGAARAAYQLNHDGSVTVTIDGTWDWLSRTDTSGTTGCGTRYGVGWGAVWNDPGDGGYPVKGPSGTYQVGSVGNLPYNQADRLVHYDPAHPCGTPTGALVNGKVTPTGAWGPLSHTYRSTDQIPSRICVNIYDLHYPYGVGSSGAPKSDYLVDKNGDSSINSKAFSLADPSDCVAVDRSQVPLGALGAVGLAGAAAAGLVAAQRRRSRNRRSRPTLVES